MSQPAQPLGVPQQQEAPATSSRENGNEFVHFTIRAVQAAQAARSKGFTVFSFLEHPEDLGATYNTPHKDIGNEPASIWQLDQVRTMFGDNLSLIHI